MANDRIILLCRCGQGVSIYKYYPHGGYETSERRQDWMTKHLKSCHPKPYDITLSGIIPFSLVTENSLAGGTWDDGILYLRN